MPARFTATAVTERLNRIYDQGFASDFHEDFFKHSGFSNFGWWADGAADAQAAAEALVLKLLEPLQPLQGPCLDVACGQGGTTRTLSRFVAPEQITAINISQQQLAAAARNAPGCHFAQMSATRLDVPDASVAGILCVEAVFHFETRRRFLQEAARVLQPGGWLALTDVFFRWPPPAQIIPPANHVRRLADYPALYTDAGFAAPRVESVLGPTWQSCARALKAYSRERVRNGKPGASRDWVLNQLRCQIYTAVMSDYLLVWAQKR